MPENNDTIAAVATPLGRGGIGVIRVSGNRCKTIYKALTGRSPKSRQVKYVSFKSSAQQTIDKGIALYFEAPSSYTGEDVMECQIHGSRVLLVILLDERSCLEATASTNRELTKTAFLTD